MLLFYANNLIYAYNMLALQQRVHVLYENLSLYFGTMTQGMS